MRKLSILLVPVAILSFGLCIWLFTVLLSIIHRPLFISPLSGNFLFSDSGEQFKFNLQKELNDKKISFTSITTQPNSSYEITLTDSSKIIISAKKDLNIQISSLQYILSRLTMEGKQFSRLDLSFDKPVIVLK